MSKSYHVTLTREDEDGTVTGEAEYTVEVKCTSRGFPMLPPSLSYPGEQAEGPEFEVEEIRDDYSGEEINPKHLNYDEIVEKALAQAYDDSSGWWQEEEGHDD